MTRSSVISPLEMAFDPASITWRFMQDQSKYSFILGPVGSGKSVASLVKPFLWALGQEPNAENIRPFKAGIVRNTMPELWRTTIETYSSVFAGYMEAGTEDKWQDIRRSSPISHDIRWEAEGLKGGLVVEQTDEWGLGMHWRPYSDEEPGLDYHVDFFALDRPQHVKGLLSYETTYLFFNEAREIPKAIVDAGGDRVGRYPSLVNGGVRPTKFGVGGDSNPPDEDHWMYELFHDSPQGWRFHRQPPGLVELDQCGEDQFKAKPGEPDIGIVPGEFTAVWQGRRYAANPFAENLVNLPVDPGFDPMRRVLGQGNYYLSRVHGKDYSWIQSYYKSMFVYVRDGRPVIPEFEFDIMAVDDLPVLADVKIGGGFDVGGGTLNPAGIIGQKGPRGIYLVHHEISISDTGVERFGKQFKDLLHDTYSKTLDAKGKERELQLEEFFGDPAGRQRDQIFEQIVFDHLKGHGIPVRAAPTNDPETRIEAIKAPMMRRIDGRPGILINKRNCPKLVKGLSGAWAFRRILAPGAVRYADKPDKGEYSHPCDALGYYLCGKGEVKQLRGRGGKAIESDKQTDEYSYWGE